MFRDPHDFHRFRLGGETTFRDSSRWSVLVVWAGRHVLLVLMEKVVRYAVGLRVVRMGVGVVGVASGAAMLPRCRRREDGLRAVGRVAPGVTPRTLGFVAAQDRGQVLLLLGELLHLLPERSVHLLQLLALLGTRDTTQRRGLGEWFSNGVMQGALRK